MENNQDLVQWVLDAQRDNEKADALIRKYLPFIRAEASKYMGRPCTQQDGHFSQEEEDDHNVHLEPDYDDDADDDRYEEDDEPEDDDDDDDDDNCDEEERHRHGQEKHGDD